VNPPSGPPQVFGVFRWIRKAAVDTWAWTKDFVGDNVNGSPGKAGQYASNMWENAHP